MKRLFVVLFSMLIIGSAVSTVQCKTLPKEWKKEYKRQLKTLKKGGWEIYGTTRSLDLALLSHFEKRCELGDKPGEEGSEVMGVASVSDARNENLLRQKAMTSACGVYASKYSMHIEGVIERIDSLVQTDQKELENFVQKFESALGVVIKGELQPSFELIRKTKENQTDMQVFYIVDKKGLLRRTLEKVKGQSNIPDELLQQLEKAVKEELENK